MRIIAIGAALVVVVVMQPGKSQASQQSSACLSNPDTAAIHIAEVKQIVTVTDSTILVNQGLPYQPAEGVTLITNSQVCSKIVAAMNSTLPAGDPRRVSAAYVMKVGRNAYAAVGSNASGVVYFYDTKYKWLAAMADLD